MAFCVQDGVESTEEHIDSDALYTTFQGSEMGRRYEKFALVPKQISPPQDLNAFVKTLNIPESMTVSKHVFSPPQPSDPSQVRVDIP